MTLLASSAVLHAQTPVGTGDFTTLSPRQELTPPRYALYALSGPGSGSYWAANGDDIYNANAGDVGIGTRDPLYPLHVFGDGTRTAVRAYRGPPAWTLVRIPPPVMQPTRSTKPSQATPSPSTARISAPTASPSTGWQTMAADTAPASARR